METTVAELVELVIPADCKRCHRAFDLNSKIFYNEKDKSGLCEFCMPFVEAEGTEATDDNAVSEADTPVEVKEPTPAAGGFTGRGPLPDADIVDNEPVADEGTVVSGSDEDGYGPEVKAKAPKPGQGFAASPTDPSETDYKEPNDEGYF